jgi:hypothetical protein
MNRKGCFRNTFFGCATLIFLFAFVFFALIISNFFKVNFDQPDTEKKSYEIVYDSLSKENVINSSFNWSFVGDNLKKKNFNLSFRLLERDVKEAMDYIDRLAKMSFNDLGFNFDQQRIDPESQAQLVWAEVYRRVFYQSFYKIKPILIGFNKIFIDQKLSNYDKVYFVISFVQNIPYDRPGGALDLFPPLGTIAYRYGDCDSKSLLLYEILEKMNVDCAMFWSNRYSHAMLGVCLPTRGTYKTYAGKKYYFLETTYPGWHIGELPPDFNITRYWYLKEIDDVENYHTPQNIKTDKDSNHNVKPSPATH